MIQEFCQQDLVVVERVSKLQVDSLHESQRNLSTLNMYSMVTIYTWISSIDAPWLYKCLILFGLCSNGTWSVYFSWTWPSQHTSVWSMEYFIYLCFLPKDRQCQWLWETARSVWFCCTNRSTCMLSAATLPSIARVDKHRGDNQIAFFDHNITTPACNRTLWTSKMFGLVVGVFRIASQRCNLISVAVASLPFLWERTIPCDWYGHDLIWATMQVYVHTYVYSIRRGRRCDVGSCVSL